MPGISSVIELRNGFLGAVGSARRSIVLLDSELRERSSASFPDARVGRLLPGLADTSYVAADRAAGFHVVDVTGKIVGTRPIPGAGGPMTISTTDARVAIAPTGEVFELASARTDTASLFVVEPSGARKEVAKLRTPAPQRTSVGAEGHAQASAGGTEFSPIDGWVALGGGRMAVVRGDPYRLEIVAADGALSRGPVVPFTGHPVSEADKEIVRKRRAASLAASLAVLGGISIPGMPAPSAVPAAGEPTWSPTKPALANGRPKLAPDGTVWVLRHDADPLRERWDVLSPAGMRMDHLRLPTGASLIGVGRAAVYVALGWELVALAR